MGWSTQGEGCQALFESSGRAHLATHAIERTSSPQCMVYSLHLCTFASCAHSHVISRPFPSLCLGTIPVIFLAHCLSFPLGMSPSKATCRSISSILGKLCYLAPSLPRYQSCCYSPVSPMPSPVQSSIRTSGGAPTGLTILSNSCTLVTSLLCPSPILIYCSSGGCPM
jgi:hypothetical protein